MHICTTNQNDGQIKQDKFLFPFFPSWANQIPCCCLFHNQYSHIVLPTARDPGPTSQPGFRAITYKLLTPENPNPVRRPASPRPRTPRYM